MGGKAILMLIYSAGLRVGEVVRLKPEDIDVNRGLIYVRGGKGRKDGYTILSEVAMESLRDYSDKYKPIRWLFPGARKEKYISSSKTIEIYTHVSNKDIGKIKSPLDTWGWRA